MAPGQQGPHLQVAEGRVSGGWLAPKVARRPGTEGTGRAGATAEPVSGSLGNRTSGTWAGVCVCAYQTEGEKCVSF